MKKFDTLIMVLENQNVAINQGKQEIDHGYHTNCKYWQRDDSDESYLVTVHTIRHYLAIWIITSISKQ